MKQVPIKSIMLGLLIWFSAPVDVSALTGSQLRQEYFVRQNMGEAMLIRINGVEAEFRSEVLDENGVLVVSSLIEGTRNAPVFQFIDEADSERQLDILVRSELNTERSRFNIELSRLTVRDQRSGQLARAYGLISFGLESDTETDEASSTVKINSFLSAANIFKDYGMRELHLWSLYYAGYFIHTRLGDQTTALGFIDDVLAEVGGVRLRPLELAAQATRADIYTSLARAGSDSDSAAAIRQLKLVERLAGSMDARFEQARVIYLQGQLAVESGEFPVALQHYQNALEIADEIEADNLATEIREDLVQIHGTRGDVVASGDVLQEIESQLLEEGGGDELAVNLLAQARLYNQTYQYDRAITVLKQALEYQNNSVIRDQIHLELSWSLYETGQPGDAAVYSRAAVTNPGSGAFRRPSTVIDIVSGLDVLARASRALGRFTDMSSARSEQVRYSSEGTQRASALFQQGKDHQAREGLRSNRAASSYRSSMAAGRSGAGYVRDLAFIHYCLAIGPGSNSDCEPAELKAAYERARASGLPRVSSQSMAAWSSWLRQSGRRSEAGRVLESLVEDVYFYQSELNGTLGGWFAYERLPVFSAYVEQAIAYSSPGQSLSAVSRVRAVEQMQPVSAGAARDGVGSRAFRASLRQRAESVNPAEVAALEDSLNESLDVARREFASQRQLQAYSGVSQLAAALDASSVIMTWHIGENNAWLWKVSSRGVEIERRGSSSAAESLLSEAHQQWSVLEGGAFDRLMDELGKTLFGNADLSKIGKLYWVPAGLTSGLPMSAVRVKSEYLLEQAEVVGLLEFPRADMRPAQNFVPGESSMFLAGNPDDFKSDFLTRLEVSEEFRSVMDYFVGPGLTVVQGSALLPDEFEGDKFSNAQLIHWSMPGVIDFSDPASSAFELSEAARGLGREQLGAQSIKEWSLDATLLVASGLTMQGQPKSSFAGRYSLMSELLNAGPAFVLATSWPGGDTNRAALGRSFYAALEAGGSIPAAIRSAQQEQALATRTSGARDWAAFQLFQP